MAALLHRGGASPGIAVAISVARDPYLVEKGCGFGMKEHVLMWQARQLGVSRGGWGGGPLPCCSREGVRAGRSVTQGRAII